MMNKMQKAITSPGFFPFYANSFPLSVNTFQSFGA